MIEKLHKFEEPDEELEEAIVEPDEDVDEVLPDVVLVQVLSNQGQPLGNVIDLHVQLLLGIQSPMGQPVVEVEDVELFWEPDELEEEDAMVVPEELEVEVVVVEPDEELLEELFTLVSSQ